MNEVQRKASWVKIEHIEEKIEYYNNEVKRLRTEKEALLLKIRESELRPDNQIEMPAASATDLNPEGTDDDLPF